MLPNFLIVGAMKAGTTSLYHYIRTHPAVFMPRPKEINFFNRHWEEGREWYESHFEGHDEVGAVGEASPNYAKAHFWPATAGRMARIIPSARLIYVLREPVDRMRSQYQHHVAAEIEHRPIDRALRDADDPNTKDYHYTSRYAFQLERFLDHFPREQVLVITTERLRDHRLAVLREIFKFIGVDENWVPPNIEGLAHETTKKIVYNRMTVRMRSLKNYRMLADHVPLNLKQKAHRLMSAPPPDVQISDELRAFLREVVLEPDLVRLRSLLDLPEVHQW